MNKERRKGLREAVDELTDIRDRLYTIMEEEREAYDNLPESLQESDRGDAMQDAADTIETVVDSIDDFLPDLEDIING